MAVYYTLVADCAIGRANWLFILNWWVAVPSAKPKLAAKFEIGWQPGYQDTILFLSLTVTVIFVHATFVLAIFVHISNNSAVTDSILTKL